MTHPDAWDLEAIPSLAPVARLRPVALAQPGTEVVAAPYAAAELDLTSPDGDAVVGLAAGTPGRPATTLRARRGDGRTWLELEHDGATSHHESRRHARSPRAEALAVTLTGGLAAAWTREGGVWRARAVLDLADLRDRRPTTPDPFDPDWLTELRAEPGADRSGTFGQVGLRDPHLVTHADGTAYDEDGLLLLSATSAGPGGFGSGHTSLWSLDPDTLALAHRGDLFFRRPDRDGVLGDHATHVVRDGERWLVATSTWGDFDAHRHPHVSMTLAVVPATTDLLHGPHVLDTVPLPAPTTAPTTGQAAAVGTWDPHLVRDDDGTWLLAFVRATRFFAFHPALATGPDPTDPTGWTLRAAATARTACEGPTVLRTTDGWRVLASHGRDGKRDAEGAPATYPVLDLDLREVGRLDAAYPTNLPWPTLARTPLGPLLIGFDSTPAGGPLLAYGTHGDLVLQRPVAD